MELIRVSSYHSIQGFKSIKVDSSLSFVQEIKDSYDQSIQVAQLDYLIVIRVIRIENDFCKCFESGISSQIILKSVVVNV